MSSSSGNSGTSGLGFNTKPATGSADTGTGQTKPKVMDEQGAIGKQFTGMPGPFFTAVYAHVSLLVIEPIITNHQYCKEHGAIGGTAQKVGGPFDKEGAIGGAFTSEGALGGKVQSAMGGEKKMDK